MESLPPRQGSQRRSSPRDHSSGEDRNTRLSRPDSESVSTASEDSQTILLNSPRALRFDTSNSTETAASATPAPPSQEDDEPRKCWICFNDETEDTADSSEWRSPCPCALTAHESCLLDWIADMEAPNSRRRAGAPAKVLCPQCKSEIRLARPRSLVVDGVRMLEKFSNMMLLPGIMVVAGSTIYYACLQYGMSTVYLIFGVEDGYRILRPIYEYPEAARGSSVLLSSLSSVANHFKLTTGLSLIPGVLIASRTSLADLVLPVIPMIFFASSNADLSLGHWPPSAALSVSLLPYLRGIYNSYYEHVWGPYERKWLREIQPRAGEVADDAAAPAAAAADPENRDDGNFNLLDIELNVNVVEEWDEAGEADHHLHLDQLERDEQFPIADAAPDAALDAAPPAAAAAAAAPDGAPAAPRPRMYTLSRLPDTILGALVFPSIAAAVGEALRLVLPRRWVTLPATTSGAWPTMATGLLQHRWGRSLVGGCLFVVVKDAVMLYVRWMMARNHRRRRVLDCATGKGRKRGVGVVG